MADDIDIANDLIDSEVSRALSKIREMSAKKVKGSDHCFECGESIPTARQNLGFSFCVPCAQEKERKKQLFSE